MADPWIGDAFGTSGNELGGIRLLVLGESHYSSKHSVGQVYPPMTHEVMQHYLAGNHLRFFANVAAAVSGLSQAKAGRSKHYQLWQSMAFYNYIPVTVADSARKFDERFWELGTQEFEKVLEDLRPDAVVVCGYRLFPRVLRRHVPGFAGDPWKFDRDIVQLGGNSRPLALRMMHPSAAFSAKAWAPKISEMLQASRKRDLSEVRLMLQTADTRSSRFQA